MELNDSDKSQLNEILIVDDTPGYLKLLSDILVKEKYTVCAVESGELALRFITEKLPAIVLLDVRMPGMDGYEVCRRLKANESTRDIPVIFISAFEDEISKIQGFQAGGVDFIGKPFHTEEVLARVATQIKLRQMQLDLETQNKMLLNEIAERKQAEEELHKQKHFFEQVFSQSSVSTQILDKDGWCEKINSKLSELFGVKPEDIEGKVYNIFRDEAIIQGGILPHLEKVFHECKPAEWEIFFDIGLAAESQNVKVARKKKVWFLNRAYPVLDHNDRLVNVIIQHTDITERKLVEEELQESETHYRTLADSGQALIWTSGIDKKCNYFNQAWLNFTGRTLDQELGDGWAEGVHPDDLQHCFETYVNAFDRREKFSMEYRVRHASGEYRWIQDDGSPRHNSKGEFIGFIGHCLDINQRKKTEEQINQLSQAVKQSPATIVITDLKGNIEYVNPKFTETTGYTFEEAKAQNPRILKSNDKLPEEYKNLWETITSGKEWRGEFKNKRKNGELYWEYASISPIRNNVGAITHFLAVKEDITDRKLAMDALRESNELNKTLLQTIPFGMDIVDQEGNVLFMSDNFKEYFGRPVTGKKCWQLYRDDKTQCPECPLQSEIKIGLTGTYEAHCILGGNIFEVSHTGLMFHGKIAMLEIFQNITERKQAELQLQKYAGELKVANETKNKFFSIIAHDLKNPFSGIIGLSEIIRTDAFQLDRESIAEFAGLINTAAAETFRLLENLLEWARLQRDAITFDPSDFTVVEMVREVVNLLAENASQKSISLIYDIPDDLGIYADRNMVTTIVRNLVSNAIKFSPFNKMITIQSVETDSMVKISVIDQGNGISKENQEKLFNLGSNFTTHGTNNEKGTGLGLVLCKEFVVRHGGEIWVESEEGKGSEFIFTLPKQARSEKEGELPT